MVKLKDSFKRCKTLKIGGFDCVINNLKGGRRRGFFAFPITLSFIFSARMHRREPMATIGVRREHGDVKKGATTTKPVRFQL